MDRKTIFNYKMELLASINKKCNIGIRKCMSDSSEQIAVNFTDKELLEMAQLTGNYMKISENTL